MHPTLYRLACSALVITTLAASTARADVINSIPSCYAANNITPFGPDHDKMVYFLIDQTVLLDKNLQTMVLENIQRTLQPGTRFTIAEFSAFSQGRYLNVVETGVIEQPIPQDQLENVVVDSIGPFNTCMRDQMAYAQRTAISNAQQVMNDSTSSLDQSDILMALKTVSTAVKEDTATDKVLVLVSDGIENSSITSFYSHDTVRLIDPSKEMDKVTANQMVSDFGGAKVYVVGGAMMPAAKNGTQSTKDGYRSPNVLQGLSDFWSKYFTTSNANLIEFGEPALVDPVSY